MKGMEKFACANWRLVNMGKKDGGLGVLDLKILNLALLGSWIKRYITGKGKFWHSIISQKYVRNGITFPEGCDVGCSSSKIWL